MRRKFLFYLTFFTGLALVALLAVLLIFSGQKNNLAKSENNKKTSTVPVSINERQLVQKSALSYINQKNQLLEIKKKAEERVVEFFSLIEEVEKFNKKNKESEVFLNKTEKINKIEIIFGFPVLGELTILEESANKILPNYYLNYVQSIANILKEEGFIPKEKEVVFNKTKDVFGFLENSFDSFIKLGAISENEAPQLRYGLTTVWPGTLEMEFRNGLLGNLQSNFNSNEFTDNFFSKITFFLKQLLIKRTFAVVCFKLGPPAPLGANLWAPCCSCMCGKVPCGCLNSPYLCPGGSAIYDFATGICGCG